MQIHPLLLVFRVRMVAQQLPSRRPPGIIIPAMKIVHATATNARISLLLA